MRFSLTSAGTKRAGQVNSLAPLLHSWIPLIFSCQASPAGSAFTETFDSRHRAECLNQRWFLDFKDARMKIDERQPDFRPHGADDNQVPLTLLKTN